MWSEVFPYLIGAATTLIPSTVVIFAQERRISQLLDRLMARDYAQYAGVRRAMTAAPPPERDEAEIPLRDPYTVGPDAG